jgi:hypothetical protein
MWNGECHHLSTRFAREGPRELEMSRFTQGWKTWFSIEMPPRTNRNDKTPPQISDCVNELKHHFLSDCAQKARSQTHDDEYFSTVWTITHLRWHVRFSRSAYDLGLRLFKYRRPLPFSMQQVYTESRHGEFRRYERIPTRNRSDITRPDLHSIFN